MWCIVPVCLYILEHKKSRIFPNLGQGRHGKVRETHSLQAWCPLVRILTCKSGYLDDEQFLSGLSGYKDKKRSKKPSVRIFCISSSMVSGWCQDILEFSIHPLPVCSTLRYLILGRFLAFLESKFQKFWRFAPSHFWLCHFSVTVL